jgi:single-strand DNA-binding protein
MAADANGLFIVGRLTKDAESKQIGENTVHEFRLAFTTREKVGGDWQDKSNYVNVAYWGSEKMGQYLVRGKQVAITGSLVYREWTSQDGSKRSVNEIRARDVQLLGEKSLSNEEREKPTPAPKPPVEEEIPF